MLMLSFCEAFVKQKDFTYNLSFNRGGTFLSLSITSWVDIIMAICEAPYEVLTRSRNKSKTKENVMKEIIFQNVKKVVLSSLFITAAFASVYAVETPQDKIDQWINECPYIGLVAKEVTYGPITLKDFKMEDEGRVVIAQPGEFINSSVEYKVAKEHLKSLHLHHIIVGIKGQNSQNCITHALAVWDTHGKAHFCFAAPTEKGIYEVRFDYQTALTCKEAYKLWRADPPSSKATVGIVIVE
jgi:hypothetical protein